MRDFTRLRESAKQDLHRVRQRLGKLLLRLGVAPPTPLRRWGPRHRAWLGTVRLPQALEQEALEEHLAHLDEADARLAKLTGRLETLAREHELAPLIQALGCLRGVGVVTAITLVAELGDLARFRSPRQLMSYVGLVPREHSSGARTRRGGITKGGNGHTRRVVVEASWHYRHAPQVGPALQRRRAEQPAAAVAVADKAQERLHRRYRKLIGRGKLAQQAVVAVARELLGFIWAIARDLAAEQAAAAAGPRDVAA